jgi:hypothetical protein
MVNKKAKKELNREIDCPKKKVNKPLRMLLKICYTKSTKSLSLAINTPPKFVLTPQMLSDSFFFFIPLPIEVKQNSKSP